MDYDLIVVGSGPAGEKGAAQAAYFGKRVAVIEKQAQPGGACLHTGTIPSKTLRESALYLSGLRSRGLFGVNYLIKRDISAQDLMYRRHHVVARELDRIQRNCDRHRIDVLHGRAEIIDRHTIRLHQDGGSRDLRAQVLLLAPGSSPFHPDYLPFDDPAVHDSDTILNLREIPRSLCIVGAGVIGSEYATLFAALGIRVILLDNNGQLLPFLDRQIASVLHGQMMKLGIQLLLQTKVAKVERVDAHTLEVHLQDGESFSVAAVLFAAGRQGNTRGLGLENIGLTANARGHIAVNRTFQTAVPNVYAAGDVVGFPALASTSMEQARVAMCHAFDLKYKDSVSESLPMGIYTIPEVSAVGETESSCQERGISYEIGVARFAENARGEIIGEEDGLIKLIFARADRRLLGVHVIGDRASEIIHVGQACIHFGGTIDYFIDAVFNYPTLCEAYKYAAYDGLGRLAQNIK